MNKKTNILQAFFLILAFSFLTNQSVAQDLTAKIASGIKTANAKELGVHFNQTLDLSTPDAEGTYSKAQAEMIVKNFFVKYPPTSYTQNHQGKSNDGSQYAIGVYKSGKFSFRTYYLLKTIGGKPLIHQLKFESEDE
ncbi:MAG: DUF4783 domain-containing protein [Lentimicrobium sp.]|jgi:hypothetical protein|nr:DUF4783 domain-containing protein [Lentimicrobium sp.]